MRTTLRNLAVASALALAGTSANAALISASSGTEAIVTFGNTNGDTITFDSGIAYNALSAGLNLVLPAAVVSFVNAAGGVANVTFGIIGGNTVNRNYLTSSASAIFADDPDEGGQQIANAVRNLWSGQLAQFVQDLNNSVPASPTSQSDTYGPFLTGTGSPNAIDGGFDNWGSGDFALSSLGAATDPLYLYTVQFATTNLGFATIAKAGGANPLLANLNFAEGRIEVAAVPAPAALWLLGTAVVPVARRALRKRQAGVAA